MRVGQPSIQVQEVSREPPATGCTPKSCGMMPEGEPLVADQPQLFVEQETLLPRGRSENTVIHVCGHTSHLETCLLTSFRSNVIPIRSIQIPICLNQVTR